MEYYDSYFDEDLDDVLTEDFDDAAEDYDESDEYGEARRRGRQRRQERRQRRRDRRNKRRGGGESSGKAASSGAVQDAFENVGQDISKVQKEVKKAQLRQSNEQMIEAAATVLFRPRLETAELAIINTSDGTLNKDMSIVLVDKDGKFLDKDGNVTTTIVPATSGYKLNDGLLPILAVKFLSNMKGVDDSKGFNKYMPLIAGVLLSPSAQKDIGIGGGTSLNSSLSNLTNNPTILLLILLLLMRK